MTTVAYRDGVMAADSLVLYGDSRKGNVQKIFYRPEAGIVGVCGNVAATGPFRRWVEEENCALDSIPECEEANALWVRPDKTLWLVEQGQAIQVSAPFYAIGSGHDLATGAMAMGATAEQAVIVAATYDVHTGMPVQARSIEPKTKPDNDCQPRDNVTPFPRR